MQTEFPEAALHVPTVLLPREDVPLKSWAVIACDQYTSEPEYWEEVEKHIGQASSTLSLIFPEVHLDTADRDAVVDSINKCMEEYAEGGVLRELPPGFVSVERTMKRGVVRRGLMVALDLEHYDYCDGSQELIRTTEGTVLGRLPPRIEVRQRARIEVPHIMVLIDDPKCTVIEPLFSEERPSLYDGELMLDGGHVRGFHIGDVASIERVAASLAALKRGEPSFLYAMGDGNHSFATAKAVWEQIKAEASSPDSVLDHPARYALVELVNIHDEGLEFEPIHRVVFGVDVEQLMAAAASFFAAQDFSWAFRGDDNDVYEQASGHTIGFCSCQRRGWMRIGDPNVQLVAGALQEFIDDFIEGYPLAKVDYIHGEASLEKLAATPQCTGFYLPALDKCDFFQTLALEGVLPRKTFSLGEAEEKRYYVECRRIVP